jgi:hypothetical protein
MSTPSWPGQPGQPPTGGPTPQPGAPTGQPYPAGQPDQGQPYTGQPSAGQPSAGQPYTGQPYAGQPAPGQPYTGQPYTGQPNPQAGPGWAPPPAPPEAGYPAPGAVPPPPKRSKRRQLIIGLVALVVVAGGAITAIVVNKKTDTVAASVGACIEIDSTTTIGDVQSKQVDCNNDKAWWIVTATGGSNLTCADSEISIYQKTSGGGTGDQVCLRPNLKVGDCWDEGFSSIDVPQKVSCTGADSTTYKVLKVDTTTSDESTCPSDYVGAYSYPSRNVLICFGDAA